jgi:hypothetical protein
MYPSNRSPTYGLAFQEGIYGRVEGEGDFGFHLATPLTSLEKSLSSLYGS